MKYFALDIETTGLCIDKDYLLEVSLVYDDGVLPIESLPTKTLVVRRELISGAITAILMHAKNGLLAECQKSLVDSRDVISQINDFLYSCCPNDKVTFAGKNIAGFDIPFLWALADRNGQRLREYHHRMLDVGSMFVCRSDKVLPSLSDCLVRAGLEGDDRHRSLSDCLNVVRCIRHKLEI